MSTSMAGTVAEPGFKPVLWTPGDWNAFFGFGTNILAGPAKAPTLRGQIQ